MKIQILRGKLGNQVYNKIVDIISTLKRKFFYNKKNLDFFVQNQKTGLKIEFLIRFLLEKEIYLETIFFFNGKSRYRVDNRIHRLILQL